MPRHLLLMALAVGVAAWTGGVATGAQGRLRTTTLLDIPESIRVDHEDLTRELAATTRLPGQTGRAAQRLAPLLTAHFDREDEFALPPLALLRRLADGSARTPEMGDAVAMADRLRAELPRLVEEHRAIGKALDTLEYAAVDERHRDMPVFVARLKRHAQREEEVLYPAAMLVGQILKAGRVQP